MKLWRITGCILLAAAGALLLAGLLPGEASAGATPPVNLSGTGSYARFPTIARAADGALCAAWTDNRDGPWNIYSACSANNGQLWSGAVRVYSSALESLHPTLLFSGSVPVMAWAESATTVFTIYQKAGDDIRVAVPGIGLPLPRPSMALGGDGSLHLVYAGRCSGSGVEDICYARRPAGGVWSSVAVIFTDTQKGSIDPRIVAGPGGILHVVWRENFLDGNNEIRYMTGTVGAGGIAWSPSVTASNVVSLAWQPDVAVTPGGDVHIVWTEKEGDNRYLVYTRFHAAGGRTPPRRLGGPFGVNENNPYGLLGVVAAGGDRVCVAWNAVPSDLQAEEVFLSCSKDGGETWSPPENLSRTPAVLSIRPSIVVAPDGSAHVVWQEFVDGDYYSNYRVYYTRWLPHSVYLPLTMRNAR